MRWMFAVAALALSCSHNVKQDYNTGDDGKIKAAKAVVFNPNTTEVKVHDIVTYPGGDRIDWRKLELPKDKTGTLSVKLKWKTPRPGLALGVDVFDQYGRQIVSEKGKHGSNDYVRKADIADAAGTYLFRVYALERGDAGEYWLTLAFAEAPANAGPGFPPPATSIPDPPHLAAVIAPTAPVTCDATNYKTAKGCEKYCPDPPDVQWKGCKDVCPQIPDVNIPACRKTMACDTWDSRIKSCAKVAGPPCADGVTTSTTCVPAGPQEGNVSNISQKTGEVEVTITIKTGHPVRKGWTGYLVDAKGHKVDGSDFTVLKHTTKEVVARIKLTSDRVDANKHAVISPP